MARAWAGPVLQPQVGISYGAVRSWTSDSIFIRASRSASPFVDPIEPIRSWSFTLDWIDEQTESVDFDDFERRMHTAGQFLVCRTDLPIARGAMLAMQQQSAGLEAANYRRDKKTFRLIETI
ncbi:MAG: hypothetical protein AB7M12_12370 [Hyphomonadaceae bacterium]